MKKQVVVIHGGETFRSYKEYLSFLRKYQVDIKKLNDVLNKKRWKENLSKGLGKKFEVLAPQMPNKLNAKYLEWEIIFKKLIPAFRNGLILVGHSLGGIFLAKYLSENELPKKIKAVFLIAPPYDDKDSEYSLADFVLPKKLDKLQNQSGQLFIFHSKDDPVVPFADFGKYQKALPKAKVKIFKDRGHFDQERLPELEKAIKNLD